jgi:UDP:flavonoid glycosyltransferase YjiC (YdhE family)
MASILFVTWDGGGNVPPALATAAELRRRGDTIRFLGHPQQRDTIEAAGFRFEPYTQARPWSATAAANAASIFAMFTDAGPGRDLVAAMARERADLVVIDCMRA